MNIDHYENLAAIVVKANELRKKEENSAKADYDAFVDYSREMNLPGIDVKNVSSAPYNSYLARRNEARNTSEDFVDNVDYLKTKSTLAGKIRNILAKMTQNELKLENYYNQTEADYEQSRDEKDDYYYNLKNVMQDKYNASKKKKSTSSKKRSSSKSKSANKASASETKKAGFDDMPRFAVYENASEGLAGDVYAKAFRDKAFALSDGGSRKADVNELNRLIKMAKSYGAGDGYLQWLSSVCGY